MQFEDLNEETNAFQRKYVNEVKRCDEMARKLRFFEKEIVKAGIRIEGSRNLSDVAPDMSAMQQMEVRARPPRRPPCRA